MCRLKEFGDYDPDHLASLCLLGSLHAIDRFFMQTQYPLSMAERSLATVSTAGPLWYSYAAYNPEAQNPVADFLSHLMRKNSEAKCDIAAYIVEFYNSRRLHSVLGNLPPTIYERNMAAKEPIVVSEIT